MQAEGRDGRRVKSVQLVKQGSHKTRTWFEANQHKLFEVIRQGEAGFDVDLAPCGHPGEVGFMHDEEVRIVEYHD